MVALYMAEELKQTYSSNPIMCFNCGNKTLMELIGEYNAGCAEAGEYTRFQLFRCPVCFRPTLHEEYQDDFMQDYNPITGEAEYYDVKTILYPRNTLDSSVLPSEVKTAYDSAMKVRNINDNICAMALRRTLEQICIDKGATKWGLKDKIEEIAQKGFLPDTLKEATIIAKKFGDDGAHKECSGDVDFLIEFVEYIIEYIYVLPAKIVEFKKRFTT